MIICLIFVVAALFEFAVVVLISRSLNSTNRKLRGLLRSSNIEVKSLQIVSGNSRSCWSEGSNNQDETDEGILLQSARKWLSYIAPNINTIDLAAFFFYLFLFVLFNCIYWPLYLKREDVYDLVDVW